MMRDAAGRSSLTREPAWLRRLLLSTALVFLAGFLLIPLAAVFAEALRKGVDVYISALVDPAALAAVRLTLLAAAIAVPVNLVFGLAASWAIARFSFPGKSLFLALIDLPFAVSPVLAGMLYLLLFGSHGLLGPLLASQGWQVIFAVPGIVLATVFVTFPFIARELIPLMQEQGPEEEEAAILLGASPWQMFRRVTLPNIRWALLAGVVLATARAMGEFGAVSVVSGHIRGSTNTVPLHVEILYNEFNTAGAFAVASVLALFSIVTLAVKSLLEWKLRRERGEGANRGEKL